MQMNIDILTKMQMSPLKLVGSPKHKTILQVRLPETKLTIQYINTVVSTQKQVKCIQQLLVCIGVRSFVIMIISSAQPAVV